MEWEQQEEMQAWAQAITVTQGGGTLGPSMVVADPTARACERCTVLLGEPEGCVVSKRGKAWACLPCQKACKVCIWPLGPGGVATAMGSETEGIGKPAPKWLRKRVERAAMNTLPRGGEKHKKVHTTTEKGEEDDDTKEVFGVLRAMVEEQRDMLGMLTQTLAAMEVCDEERLTISVTTTPTPVHPTTNSGCIADQ